MEIKVSKQWEDKVDLLPEIIKTSNNIAEVCRKLGLRAAGNNHKTIKRYASLLQLDVSHFDPSKASLLALKRARDGQRIPLEQVLIEESHYPSNKTKKRVLSAGLLEEICSSCGMGPVWNDKKLVLQLEHKNGIHTDNRLENLELLCPNCHSQTNTYCGKNKKTK